MVFIRWSLLFLIIFSISPNLLLSAAAEEVEKGGNVSNGIENGMPITFYQNSNGSPESKVHQNRVFACSDHSNVTEICERANSDNCFCEEHERYTFSFCRKSCGYCSQEDDEPYKYWQIKSMESLEKTPIFKDAMFLAGLDQLIPLSSRFAASFNSTHNSLSDYPRGNNSWFKKSDPKSFSLVGFEFQNPVVVSGVFAEFQKLNKHNIFSVESSKYPNGPFKRRWVFRAKDRPSNSIHIRSDCPILWKRFESYDKTWCFKTFASFRTWSDASKECKDNSATLAFIRNKKENDFLIKNVKPCGKVWIGYNDRQTEGQYKWDGYSKIKKDQFTNWDEADSDSKVQQQVNDCTVMRPNGAWVSEDCSEKNYFICRKEADKIPDVKYDNNNPDIFAPMLFLEEDLSVPYVNNTLNQNKKYKEDFKYLPIAPQPVNTVPQQPNTATQTVQKKSLTTAKIRDKIKSKKQNRKHKL